MANPTHTPVQEHTNLKSKYQQQDPSTLQFSDPDAEHQFQQSYAASRRFWDAATAVATLAILSLFVNLPALRARVCNSPLTTQTYSQGPLQLRSLLCTFPCADSNTTQLAQATWLLRHWVPATIALYQINGDLEGSMATLCCIAVLACLVWNRGAAVRAAGYSQRRTLLMSIWRVGNSMCGFLVLVMCKLQLQPGWPICTVEMYWGRHTMYGATRLLWHTHLMPVSPSSALAYCIDRSLLPNSGLWVHSWM